jgi:pantoate--beta-alanine ligase
VTAAPVLAVTRAEIRSARARLGSPVVFVATMGALHAGHRSLLRQAARMAMPNGAVVVSIFVNPRQFGPAEDLDRYPRTLEADLALCAEEGVAVVFAPAAAEMYPAEQMVTVDPGPMGQVLEGEFRPGFFGGVLTIVLKLFELIRPDIAVFGEKDAQQLALVRRMAADLNLGIQVASVPTVRDEDGLATSSRNRYLSAAERSVALALPAALDAGRAKAAEGPQAVLAAAREVLDRAGAAERVPGVAPWVQPDDGLPSQRGDGGFPGDRPDRSLPGDRPAPGLLTDRLDGRPVRPPLTVDYLALVDPRTFAPVRSGYTGPAVLAVAARVGTTRLIDNVPLEFIQSTAGATWRR